MNFFFDYKDRQIVVFLHIKYLLDIFKHKFWKISKGINLSRMLEYHGELDYSFQIVNVLINIFDKLHDLSIQFCHDIDSCHLNLFSKTAGNMSLLFH